MSVGAEKILTSLLENVVTAVRL